MRRAMLAAAVLSIAGLLATAARRPAQDRPLQADGIVRLLLDLQNALTSGQVDDLRAIATPDLSDDAVTQFTRAAGASAGAGAVVRERMRRPADGTYDVVADLLVSGDRTGRVATWQILAAPADGGAFRIRDLRELAAVDGLLRLRLDPARQFAVKDLVIHGPDLALRMSTGTAFVAESPNGITALVLRGRGEAQFSPPDQAEQGQVRIFSGRPTLTQPVDAAFVRLNPADFAARVTEHSLTPVAVRPAALERARQIFDDRLPRTYNVDLRHLTPDRYSLEPPAASLVVEFRTSRFGWLTYARSPNENEDVTLFDRDRQRTIALYSSRERLEQRGPSFSDEDTAQYDVEHYRVDLAFDPARLWVSGRASIRVRVRAGGATSLLVRLAQPLAVASVTSPELGELLALRIMDQNTVLVALPAPVERGRQATLEFVYGGRLEPQAIDREALQVAGQRSTEPDTIRLTPEPRFVYSNRVAWYPQAPVTDYATAGLRLTVPSEYQVVATGTPTGASVVLNQDVGRSGSKSLRIVDYTSSRPVRYLGCVISRFVPIGRSRIEVPALAPPAAVGRAAVNLEVVSTSRMAGRNRQMLPRVAAIVRFYADLIGEAPYPDFTLAAVDDDLPGGHSPAYFALLHQPLPTSPYVWGADPVAFDDLYAHFFLAHEVAHQWWGQAIGWKNYREQWLSEGLAQYFAALYAADDRGPALLDTLVAGMRAGAEPFLAQGPISLGYRLGHLRSDGRVFRAIVYNKAAVVLHMLRRLVGDEAFFGGLRRFYATWRFRKAGTDDLQIAMQAGTTVDVGRFFAQWVRGQGRPRVRLSWSIPGGDGRATIRVEQVGETFLFPLTVQVHYADGRSELRAVAVTDAIAELAVDGTSPIRRVTPRDPLTLFEMTR